MSLRLLATPKRARSRRITDRSAALAALRAARERLRAALLADFQADPTVLSRELRRVVATIATITRRRRRTT